MTKLSGCMLALAVALGACTTHQPAANQPLRAADASVDWAHAKTVTVALSDFEFTPDHLTLRAGQPVRLMLSNTGSGKHDFSAPAFFAASSFKMGGTPPIAGKMSLAQNQKAEIDVVPNTPGQYPLDCTEFLHDMLGMTGQITVPRNNPRIHRKPIMITVYHLENSRSERVIWLMEELGLKYDLQRFDREPTMAAPDALKTISPMGKAPMIRDGDTVIVESGAILEYIANTQGSGRLAVKPGAPNYAAYLQWMHFAEGSAMARFILNLFVGGFFPGIDPSSPLVGMAKHSSAQVLGFIEDELAKTPYFAGDDFTAADIMMMYCFGIVRSPIMSTDMSQYPNIAAYLARIEARPAYQKGMAIANPKK